MRWQGLEEFVAVVEQGSFSKASRVLGVSKSHVSQQVSRLEDRLGVRLLHRTTRKLSLTESGAKYLAKCVPIIEMLDAATSEVTDMHSEVAGKLAISAPHLLAEVLLMPLLMEFQTLHPQLQVTIDLTSRRVDLLEEGYDIALQMGAREDVRVVNRTLLSTQFCAVASPKYIEEHGQPQSPEALKSHQCLLFASQGRSKPWKFQRDGRVVQIQVPSRWRSNSGHLLRVAAIQGVGIAYLPDYYLQAALAENLLVPLLSNTPSIARSIVAIYQNKTHLDHKVHAFLSFLQARLNAHKTLTENGG